MTEQATRPDGLKRWHVFVQTGDSPVTIGRKATWAMTADEAHAKTEAMGYTVERVEPAPPATF
jgi:hypothetical protein